MSDEIANFIDALQKADLEMTGEEIAETLWLATRLTPAHETLPPIPQQHPPLPPQFPNLAPPADKESISDFKKRAGSDIYIHSPEPIDKNEAYRDEASQSGKLIRMPTASALADSLILGRALRPLRRRARSHTRFVLNEEDTIYQIAEMQKKVWIPVVEPAPERWFELALVIDEGASMIFWQQTVAELCTFFERLGAFRDIRLWKLLTNNEEEAQLYVGTDPAAAEQRWRDPKELIDPTGRRLILVVTDCISPAWYGGKVQDLLELWGARNLVTLLQMLPQRLWPRTALCAAQRIHLTASAPGMANAQLKTSILPSRLAPDLSSIRLPIITLHQQSLAAWARMVMGAETTKAAGVQFTKNRDDGFAVSSPSQSEEKEPTAQERIRYFRATAPTAHKLARLLSATPITMPIVRVIQQTMLPDPEHMYDPPQLPVAEVFLGGLLKKVHQDASATHPEYVEYEFLPGVREELARALPRADEYRVLREVSAFMEKHFGISHDFLARYADPNASGEFVISPESRPFATIAIAVWRKLGGEYAELANILERQFDKPEPAKPAPPLEDIPEALPTEVERQIQELLESTTKPSAISTIKPSKVVRFPKVTCPSCFEEIYLGECRIISGKTGMVLKEAPQDWLERRLARSRPEAVQGPDYIVELARRECSHCGYHLPQNIESVPGIALAVVGDVYAGKSHYIASLLRQLLKGIGQIQGVTHITCMTPKVEEAYISNYLEPVFIEKRSLLITLPATETTANPLIYQLSTIQTPHSVDTAWNLIIYDASGEDFHPNRLVSFARFIFDAGAFICVADPVMMLPVLEGLPVELQNNIRQSFGPLVTHRPADRINTTFDLFERYHRGDEAISRNTPIAIMLSKVDLFRYLNELSSSPFGREPYYEGGLDLEDINAVDQEVRGLLKRYRQADLLAVSHRFNRVKFFATSATGEPPDVDGRFKRVEPFRCLDPLLWILYCYGIIQARPMSLA
ncbi:MAG TPA: SAV_2336 N-terminal domain-related protein [Ktedonosporobacter sp.]|jgi:hypothetical protein|nr:SAV_2336 N-terminal domain-related protein [Ktedonosporobacter sp.]